MPKLKGRLYSHSSFEENIALTIRDICDSNYIRLRLHPYYLPKKEFLRAREELVKLYSSNFEKFIDIPYRDLALHCWSHMAVYAEKRNYLYKKALEGKLEFEAPVEETHFVTRKEVVPDWLYETLPEGLRNNTTTKIPSGKVSKPSEKSIEEKRMDMLTYEMRNRFKKNLPK